MLNKPVQAALTLLLPFVIIGIFLVQTSETPPLTANAAQTPLSENDDKLLYLPLVLKQTNAVKNQISTTTLALPQPLAPATGSFCTDGGCAIGPRLYHEPLADGRFLVGWTDSSGNGHLSVINGSAIQTAYNYVGQAVRGLVVHGDNSFALLLWDPAAETISLSRRSASNSEVWRTNLPNSLGEADFAVGDSRLAYGNGRYGAYFTVEGTVGAYTDNYGDQLTYVDDDGNILSGWNWGCSHSLGQLISYNPTLKQFAPICVSDCYPDKGIVANNAKTIYQSAADCQGNVSTQLGQVLPITGTWKLLFNAQDEPCCKGQGIGLVTIDQSYQSDITWLTNSDGLYERDPAMARLGTDDQSDRYLVGWVTIDDDVYRLGVIDGGGVFRVLPEEVNSIGVRWGNRDNPFRTTTTGAVSWVQGDPLTAELRLHLFDGAPFLP